MASLHREDRRGRLRRLDEERRTEGERRQEARRLLPMGAGRVDGEMLILSTCRGQIHHLVLWDLTRQGACVAVSGPFEEEEGTPCRLSLYEYQGHDSVWVQARILWIEPTEADTFVGLEFDQPLPPGTFLAPYLTRNWAE